MRIVIEDLVANRRNVVEDDMMLSCRIIIGDEVIGNHKIVNT